MIRAAFLTWAVVSTLWLANSMRTRGVDESVLRAGPRVAVLSNESILQFAPARPKPAGLLFFCSSGVAAEAYAPLLRPVAEAGHPVFLVRLPWRFAPLESHRSAAIRRARAVIGSHDTIPRWVIAGHSLGGALAARMVRDAPPEVGALVLIGTTHPKEHDLSSLAISVTKVYGTADGVAPAERVHANAALLPKATRWVDIRGGNHSQFGHYGHQILDGDATISRGEQQRITREAILDALAALVPARGTRPAV